MAKNNQGWHAAGMTPSGKPVKFKYAGGKLGWSGKKLAIKYVKSGYRLSPSKGK